MEDKDCAYYINKISSEKMREIVDIIIARGFVTDEDGFFAKVAMKKEYKLIFKRIRNHYYFNLDFTSHYYPTHGEVAVIYDLDAFEGHQDLLKRGLDAYVTEKSEL